MKITLKNGTKMSTNHLKFVSFPNCCGITVLNDFGWSLSNIGANKNKKLKIKEILEEVEYYNGIRKRGLILIALNNEQNNVFSDILLKIGYKLIEAFVNAPEGSYAYPKDESKCFLYSRNVTPLKMPRKRRKRATKPLQEATVAI